MKEQTAPVCDPKIGLEKTLSKRSWAIRGSPRNNKGGTFMKRLILFVVILSIFIPSCCLSSDIDFAGVWSVFIPKKLLASGNLCITLVLNEDGSMAFMNIDSTDPDNLAVNTESGTWKAVGSVLSLYTKDKSSMITLEYDDDYLWFELEHYRIGMSKTPDFSLSQFQFFGD